MFTQVKPVGHRNAWTAEDDLELRQRCEAGEFIPMIAKAMGRTQEAVRSRANTLGVPCRSSARKKLRPPTGETERQRGDEQPSPALSTP